VRGIVLSIVLGLAACGPSWKQTPHDQLFQYEAAVALIPPPPSLDANDFWDRLELLFVRPLGRAVSPATYAMDLVGAPDAEDVNRLGQVPDSAWFENRIGRRDYSAEEVTLGAARNTGLADGPLTVFSGKIEGVSAGFVIRDTEGQTWYLKLDHPAFPQLSTSAEVISSRLLWLAGYRVPAMHALDVEPSRFVLDKKATTKDKYNRKVALTQEELALLLTNTNPDANGRIRVLISRQPPGSIVGSFEYRGLRRDDPNDTIEHERRRSLRALWLFSAWINNTDTRAANTLDMFHPLTSDGRGVIEHYLIDFGDAFGASGTGEKTQSEGWENLVDFRVMLKNLFTLGALHPAYMDTERSSFRSVGLFEARRFEPGAWKPALPNPAFDQRTSADLFWAASILARIQPDHVRAAVSAGHYSEEGAAEYVVETLLERRSKLLEYAFKGYVELDRPRMDGTVLRLDDLRVLGAFEIDGGFRYEVRWSGDVLARGRLASKLPVMELDLGPALAARPAGFAKDPFLTVELRRGSRKLIVRLRVDGERVLPIAVER
jgi:hypothetical protein